MTKIFFYNCADENKKLKKNISYISEKKIYIMDGVSILEPIFVVSDIDIANINYCFIDKFKRYYFIKWTTNENGMFVAECNVDVLYTFKNEILSNNALIKRQEFVYDDFLIDENVKEKVGTITQKKKIGRIGNTISYVLTVTGGGE